MKRPAIFFDRDNTLIVSDGFLGDPDKVVLMEGTPTAIARARAMGFATVTVSNQSGVARGMFNEEAVEAVNRRVDEMLQSANAAAVIDRHEYCPFHPEASVEKYRQESDLRKPKPGMILAAAQALALDLSRSWLIGDAPRDIEAGKTAGCRTVLLKDPTLAASPAADEQLTVAPDSIVSSLEEAMDFVQEHAAGPPAPEPPADPNPTTASPEATESRTPNSRLESLAEMILLEVRKRNEHHEFTDFSVSKLLAGIVQVLALAIVFVAYLNRESETFFKFMFAAIFLQIFTVALLLMGRQK